MVGISAVVPCGCVVGASLLVMFAIVLCGCVAVAGSVVSDTTTLLLCSVEVAVGSEQKKGKQKLNMIDW